jgi:hypothetical protein
MRLFEGVLPGNLRLGGYFRSHHVLVSLDRDDNNETTLTFSGCTTPQAAEALRRVLEDGQGWGKRAKGPTEQEKLLEVGRPR